MAAMVAATALLCACGEISNEQFKRGDLMGRVLRGDKDTGRVVLMGTDPKEAGLDGEGRFHFSAVDNGPHELMIVASGSEALRVPVLVAGGQLNDLQDLDPVPAAFLVIDLYTQGQVADCWVKVHLTDLKEVHSPDGSYQFVVGPLGAGCYTASMEHSGSPFWSQTDICLDPGEQRAFDVTW
jgi:hypothetical protein